jgi:hypothetical protein
VKLRSDWAKAYEPYARALRRLKLPKRGLPGSVSNIERVEAIARTLRADRAATPDGSRGGAVGVR